ncbi:hypothetical protein QO002_002132 [Pararhizobium capsulatum DSM 1112]|uniref:Uncharacterized protein n=1 Tax=Pararhizobium capsulatum DSM 1112 TaxID=1121113 RepID=A0ABU0BP11_9HYPH|nr:hypothetical protein [Pararhizobium capsulatum DSM 1112]
MERNERDWVGQESTSIQEREKADLEAEKTDRICVHCGQPFFSYTSVAAEFFLCSACADQ